MIKLAKWCRCLYERHVGMLYVYTCAGRRADGVRRAVPQVVRGGARGGAALARGARARRAGVHGGPRAPRARAPARPLRQPRAARPPRRPGASDYTRVCRHFTLIVSPTVGRWIIQLADSRVFQILRSLLYNKSLKCNFNQLNKFKMIGLKFLIII